MDSLENEAFGTPLGDQMDGLAAEDAVRERRLDATGERIASLLRRTPDDMVASHADPAGDVAVELSELLEELTVAYDQLRRQTEELRDSRRLILSERDRFRELFDVAPEGLITTDGMGMIREVNRGAATLLNVPNEYVVGKPIVVFINEPERRAFRTRIYRARVDAAEQEWTSTLNRRDGEPVRTFFSVGPMLDAHGQVTGLRWLLRDVSSRLAPVANDRTPSAVLRAAIDAMSAHLAVLDVDGAIVTINRAWRDAPAPAGLFAAEGAHIGANYLDLCAQAVDAGLPGAVSVREALMRVIGEDQQRADALYSNRRDGWSDEESDERARWFSLRVTRCDGPLPAMFVVSHEDVTTERRAYSRERALHTERTARAAAEAASRAKSEFLATLSHELRTPLNAIGGYAQLLEMGVRGPVTAQQAEDLRRILRSEQHLLGLINELLNFARVERGDVPVTVTPVRVADATREVVDLLEVQALAKSVKLSIDCAADLYAMADAEKLRQILLNLLSNAVKFTPSSGAIEVTCTASEDRVLLRVHDTGIGIPSAKLDVIFDPFVQVHRGSGSASEGIGLGLAISRSLARAMGGEVSASSTPGVGSCFELSLARAEPVHAVT
ncbi:MAG TPA: PAS domain-containing sensor histidine kinase [Gemmatimonadaceae bacterium]|nr:PAS domain-containing sensor histidine kinase [Gemmatimonadaceae bacterium]